MKTPTIIIESHKREKCLEEFPQGISDYNDSTKRWMRFIASRNSSIEVAYEQRI